MGDVTDMPARPKTRKETLVAAFDRADAVWQTASTISSDVEFAAGVLEAFAIDCSEPHRERSDREIERQWPQIEWIARQLLRHAGELEDALAEIERATSAIRRAAGVMPDLPPPGVLGDGGDAA